MSNANQLMNEKEVMENPSYVNEFEDKKMKEEADESNESVEQEEPKTAEEERQEREKAKYHARMVLMRIGSPGERLACTKAMRKMEVKYGMHSFTKALKKSRRKKA